MVEGEMQVPLEQAMQDRDEAQEEAAQLEEKLNELNMAIE